MRDKYLESGARLSRDRNVYKGGAWGEGANVNKRCAGDGSIISGAIKFVQMPGRKLNRTGRKFVFGETALFVAALFRFKRIGRSARDGISSWAERYDELQVAEGGGLLDCDACVAGAGFTKLARMVFSFSIFFG